MKITTVKYFRKRSPLTSVDSRSIIILLFVFAASMIIGAGTAGKSDTAISAQLNDYIAKTLELCASEGFFKVFLYSFLINVSIVSVVFLNGFNCIGLPLCVLIPSLRGIGAGLIAGSLYSSGGAGIAKYCLTVLPGSVISVTAVLLACNESAYMSVDILSLVLGHREATQNISIKKYAIKFALICIIILVSAITDSITLAGINQLLSS